MVAYLETRIAEHKTTDQPRWGMCADGYTQRSGAPTSHMIRLDGETRWRRLMVWCFSNCGTLFVRIKGVCLVVHEYDIPEVQA